MPHTPTSQMRTLTTAEGHSFQAWEACPPAGTAPRAGLVVLQEIFGLTDYIREVCNMLASHGYHVLAPAIFDLIRPGLILPYDEAGITEGLALLNKLPPNGPLQEISACVAALREKNPTLPVGAVGFCWGGLLAWKSAQTLPINAASCWYGGGIAADTSPAPHCPTELQFGSEDAYIPSSDWEKIRKACPDVKMYIYEGADHGFGCTARPSYNKAAADLAWERTLTFFAKTLGQGAQPASE